MRKITTAILCFILCLSQYQIIAQCTIPQFTYSGVNSQYNLNSPIPTLNVTNIDGGINVGETLLDFNTPIAQPTGVTIDAQGNIYVLESANNLIKKIDTNGNITIVASGFNSPRGLCVDSAGNLYVADTNNHLIKKIATDNTVTILGSGFSNPRGIAVDPSGNVYVADTGNNAIKKISPDNVVSTVVTGLSIPSGVAVDAAGNIYVADTGNNSIKKISPDSSISILGFGFQLPEALCVDLNGIVYVADTGTNTVKKITLDNQVTSLVGAYTAPKGIAVDGNGKVHISDTDNNALEVVTASNSVYSLTHVNGLNDITTDAANNVYVLDRNNKLIRKRSAAGTISIAARGLTRPVKMALDPLGNLYVADEVNLFSFYFNIKKISPNGTITNIATNLYNVISVAADGLGQVYIISSYELKKIDTTGGITTINSYLQYPYYVACDSSGNVFVTDQAKVNKITGNEVVTISNGSYNNANYFFYNMALDQLGNIYTSEYNRLIKVDHNGRINFNNNTNYNFTEGIAVDSYGMIYLVSQNTNLVRKLNYYQISPLLPLGLTFSNGQISGTPIEASEPTTYTITAANDCGVGSTQITFGVCNSTLSILSQTSSTSVCEGSSTQLQVNALGCNVTYQWYKDGDMIVGAIGMALDLNNISSATLGSYHCVVTGSSGSVTSAPIVLSLTNSPVLSYAPVSPIYTSENPINPILATNTGGAITPSSESIFGVVNPKSIVKDSVGNLYVLESNYETQIRKITPSGVVTLFGPAIFNARQITVDSSNNIYVIVENNNSAIQKIDPSGNVSIVATGLNYPRHIKVDADGNIYYLEFYNNFIKKIAPNGNVTSLGSGLNNPVALTFDSNGNIYVVDQNGYSIKKIAGNGTVTTVYTISGNYILDIDIDTAGNLYIADGYLVTKINLNNSTSSVIDTLFNKALFVDNANNVYTVDQNKNLKKIEPDGDSFILLSGFGSALSIANDATGNTYIADGDNFLKQINGTTLISSSSLQLANTTVVFVDALNTLYTANTYGYVYKKVSGGTQTLFKSGLGNIANMVADGAGNLYVSNENSNVIKKINPNGTVTNLSLGLGSANGMAVDGQGNLYVADKNNDSVKKIAPNGTITTVGSGFNDPIDVAVDPSGMVYVADRNNSAVKMVSPDGNISILRNGFTDLTEISLDGLGNLYALHANRRRISKISSLISYTVTPSLPNGLILDPESGTISGTPTTTTAFTNYTIRVGNSCGNTATTIGFEVCAPPVINNQLISKSVCQGSQLNLEVSAVGCGLTYQWLFNGNAIPDANTSTLVISNVTSAESGNYSCEVSSPYGNITSNTAAISVLTTLEFSYQNANSNYQYGAEMTPLNLTITEGTITTSETSISDLSSGTQTIQDITRDNDGNIYMVGYSFNGIKKWSPNGTLTTLYSGLGSLNVITTDNQNNLYVASTYGSFIKKIAVNGTVTTLVSGGLYPKGLAVDNSGMVYVSDIASNSIKKIALDGTMTTMAVGLNYPNGLVVNEDGSLYVADSYSGAIKLISPEGLVTTIVNNLQNLFDLSKDERGNLYFTEEYIGNVKKLNAQGVVSTITNISGPYSIVADSEGILYVGSFSGTNVKKITPGILYTIAPPLPSGMSLDRLTGTISGTPQEFMATTNYTVSIDNGCTIYSTEVSFSACGPIIIDTQPLGQTTCSGYNNIFLDVAARGCNLSYQWYKNNTPIEGANTNQLALFYVEVNDSGDYSCLVMSSEGNLMSDIATVVINATPIISYNGLSSGYLLNEPMTPLTPTNTGGEILLNNYNTSTYRSVPTTFINDMVQDAAGNFYVCDTFNNTVKKVDTNGNVTVLNDTITQPTNIAVDSAGNVYVTDPSSNSVYKIDAAGNLSTFSSGFDNPVGIAVDASDKIYVSELLTDTIKKLNSDGTLIRTWAVYGNPYSLAVSPTGKIYVANNLGIILKIENDIVTEFPFYVGYVKLSAGSDDTLYIGGSYNYIQKIKPNGELEVLPLIIYSEFKVLYGGNNDMYVSDNNLGTIQRVTGPSYYSITPALPEGMQFDAQTGIISGTPTVLTPSTTYVVKTNNNCGDNYAYLTFAVCTATVINLQPVPQTVCAGTAVNFEVSGSGSNVTYQWLKDNVAIAGATNPIYSIQYATDNDVATYSCLVSGNCGNITSDAVNLVVVNNNSSSITTQPVNTNLCKPTGATTSFSVATIMPAATFTWQYRVVTTANLNPAWITITNSVNGVYSGYNTPTLNVTKTSALPANGTQYRVVVNGTCGSVNSEIATVNIVGSTVAGRITSPTSVCLDNDITFVLSGYSGTSLQWQSAPNATGTFTDIAGANEPTYTLTNAQSNSNLSYRVVVSNSCDNTTATTAIKTIKVDLPSLSGTVTGGGYLCSTGSGSLKITGYRGKIQWEYSTDGINFSNAPKATDLQTIPFSTTSTVSTSTSYLVSNLTTNVYFRAKVTNGTCTTEYSNVVLYTIVNNAVAGYITTGSTTICAGTGITLLELNDEIGTILWERSTDLVTWYSTGKTQSTFEVKNLTVRTAYRAKVSVGGCATVYSQSIFIELIPKSLAKAIAVNTTLPSGKTALTAMCTNDASKVLTIGNGYVGAIQWQRSATSNTLGYTNIEGANGQSYTVTNPLVGANYFRAKFTNSCGVSVYSAAVIVYYTDCIQARAVVSNKKMSFDALAYPNPYSDTFRLKLSTSSESEVTLAVYDMTGKLLERSVKRPEDIQQEDLGLNYASGVYNIVVTQDEETKTVRIVKR